MTATEQTENQKEQQWHHLVTVEDLGDLKRKINVTYDANGVKMAMDKAAKEVGRRVQVKGFRRGKAPAQMVRAYCKKEIETAASTMLSQEGYLHAAFEHKLSAMTEPKVEDAEFHLDGTFSCSITVEVKPHIELSGYVGLQLEKPADNLHSVREELFSELRRGFAVLEDQEAVSLENTVVADLKISIDGEEVFSQESQLFRVTEEEKGPMGLDLVEVGVGEEVSGPFEVPEGEHQGKTADVTLTVRRVMEVRPASDEELVERLKGSPDFKDVEELHIEDIRAKVTEQAKILCSRQERAALEEQAVDKLLELHGFDVPSAWIESEEEHLRKQLGLKGDEGDEVLEQAKSMAERNVRRSFIMDAIYDAEPGLKVTQEDYDRTVAAEASRVNMSLTTLKKKLQRDGRVPEVVSVIKNRKIMDYLLANADVQGVEPEDAGFQPVEFEEE